MVRQFEQPPNENLTLLVDLWQPGAARPTPMAKTRGIGDPVCGHGRGRGMPPRRKHVRVVIAGKKIATHRGGASKSLAREVLSDLATAESLSRGQLDELVAAVNEARPTAGQIVMVTRTRAFPMHRPLHFRSGELRPGSCAWWPAATSFFSIFTRRNLQP